MVSFNFITVDFLTLSFKENGTITQEQIYMNISSPIWHSTDAQNMKIEPIDYFYG